MSKKVYRPNVAAVIVSPSYPKEVEILIAERSDIQGAWQFVQGGIDHGETPEIALFREIEEEIGTAEVEVVGEYPEWISYDFPERVAKKMKPFAGQSQRYYLVRLKPEAIINLETEHPEFCDYKFVSLGALFDHVAAFKKPVYEQVVKYFKDEGLL